MWLLEIIKIYLLLEKVYLKYRNNYKYDISIFDVLSDDIKYLKIIIDRLFDNYFVVTKESTASEAGGVGAIINLFIRKMKRKRKYNLFINLFT